MNEPLASTRTLPNEPTQGKAIRVPAPGASSGGLVPGAASQTPTVCGPARRRVPDRSRRVGAVWATRLVDPPRAADHQPGKRLTRVVDELQTGADAELADTGLGVRAERPGGLAGGVGRVAGMLAEQPRGEG